MRHHVTTLALCGCLLAATGCGSSGAGGTAEPPAAAGSTAPAVAAKHFTADEVATALKAHGLPLRNVIVYNESNDPNQRLGRPGQYTSKVSFADPRVKKPAAAAGQPQDVDSGGSVEVFDNPADALSRGQYIQTARRGVAILGAEYDYISGGALLRLAGALTPSQARQYASALKAIVGMPIVTPSPAHT